MTLNKEPHYEAIGRCVYLKKSIKSRIKYLEHHLSHINMCGVAPYYYDGDHPNLSIKKININLVERLANEIRDVYSEIYRSATEYNQWAELAGYEAITICNGQEKTTQADNEDAKPNS